MHSAFLGLALEVWESFIAFRPLGSKAQLSTKGSFAPVGLWTLLFVFWFLGGRVGVFWANQPMTQCCKLSALSDCFPEMQRRNLVPQKLFSLCGNQPAKGTPEKQVSLEVKATQLSFDSSIRQAKMNERLLQIEAT